MYPVTISDWWSLVDKNWPKLKMLIAKFDPQDVVKAAEFKDYRSKHLASIFEETWHRAPDKPFLHTEPGWSVLCDLCSESHLLND